MVLRYVEVACVRLLSEWTAPSAATPQDGVGELDASSWELSMLTRILPGTRLVESFGQMPVAENAHVSDLHIRNLRLQAYASISLCK